MILVYFLIAHWFLSLFCQTFFLHRYAAHRMFTLSKFWEKSFYLATFVLQGSSALNPRAYAIMHRLHHAYSDTDDDPHTPRAGSLYKMVKRMLDKYNGLRTGRIEPSSKFTQNLPQWKYIDDLIEYWPTRILFGTLYTCVYFHYMTSFWWLLLLPVHYLMGPIHGTIVNWCGHRFGYRNYEIEDDSKNTLVWDVLMMGELYQNNHHKNPNRMNFAVRWFELDPGFLLSKCLSFLRIIKPVEVAVKKNRENSPADTLLTSPQAAQIL